MNEFDFQSLDVDASEFKQWMQSATEIINDWFRDLDKKKVFHNYSSEEIREHFWESLPEEATPVSELLETVSKDVFLRSTLNIHPQFYAYITGAGNQISILAELLRNALNQNNLKWHSAPANTEIERIVIEWIADFIGYGKDCGGVLASGGAIANFLSLAVARKIKAPENIAEEGLYGCPPLTVYVSAEGHSSFDKAIDMLGVGRKYLRKIPVDADYKIRTDKLVATIEADIAKGFLPICIAGIAGTTNTGAVDPLEELAEISQKYNCWYHIDAAYGGPAARLADQRELFKGIDLGDSLIINPHKWLFIPFESACVLVRDPNHLRKTFSLIPDYLQSDNDGLVRHDLMEYNLQLTKDFKALKIWMAFKAYGAKRILDAVQWDIQLATYLASKVKTNSHFELLAPPSLSIVCFRYLRKNVSEDDLNELNQRILYEIEADGRVFFTGTKLKGKTALRCCLINHRRTHQHIDQLLDVITEIAEKIINE